MTDNARRLKIGKKLLVTVEEFGPPLIDEPAFMVVFYHTDTKNPMPGFTITLPSAEWKRFREFIFGIELPR